MAELTHDELDRIRVQALTMRPLQRERLLRLLLEHSARGARIEDLERSTR